MSDDPLMQFVKGEYEKPKSIFLSKWTPLLLSLYCSVFLILGINIAWHAVSRLSPLRPTAESQGIIKSKRLGPRGRYLFLERKHIINYYYPAEANPAESNVFNGYHSVSWSAYRKLEVGEIVTIKHAPAIKNPRKRSYIEGARPLINIAFEFLFGGGMIVFAGFMFRLGRMKLREAKAT